MNKIIWTCWFQGREKAPTLVKKCISSWESQNPDWEVRCLDASTVSVYLNLDEHIDLSKQTITAASASDILRVLLLHEYGGVWIDSTLYCNQPLSAWLPIKLNDGFFAFSRPGRDRMLASWFLASTPDNPIIKGWTQRVVKYWEERTYSKDYFWFHHLFTEMYSEDASIRVLWEGVPKVSADGPHSVIRAGMLEPIDEVRDNVDWSAPLFKLTYRLDSSRDQAGSLIDYLLLDVSEELVDDRFLKEGAQASRGYSMDLSSLEKYFGDYSLVIKQKRIENRDVQIDTIFISTDKGLLNHVPESISKDNFIANFINACRLESPFLIDLYQKQARLVITTSPYCALSAISRGIPIVVFFPFEQSRLSRIDRDAFAFLSGLVRVFSLTEANKVNWQGYCPDISYLKLPVVESFVDCSAPKRSPIGPFASSDRLPVANGQSIKSFIKNSERIARINSLGIPDRHRWSIPSSYDREWDYRASLAADLIPDGASVFEVGSGLGYFRTLISGRCNYVGADLEPLDEQTLAFDFDYDEIPKGKWDYLVLLGVLEYLHKPLEAVLKLKLVDNLVLSYCCRLSNECTVYSERKMLGWANHFSEDEILSVFRSQSFEVVERVGISSTTEYEQILFKFNKIS